MKPSEILVFSDEPRGRVFVGELSRTDGGYSFVYDHDYMSRATATPLGPDLPFSLNKITSKKLFDSLWDLVPDKKNPAYEQYCRFAGVHPEEKDPMVLLACLGGGPSRFVFELAPLDMPPRGKDVVQLRNGLGLSQRQLAIFLDIPFASLQAMEKETADVTTARRLLQMIIENPSVLWKIIQRRGIYLSREQLEGVRKYVREYEAQEGRKALEKQKKYREIGYLEVFHGLENGARVWNQIELLKAAKDAQCNNTGWPIGVVMERADARPIFRSKGIESEIESGIGSYDEWSLARDGSYHFFRSFAEDRETQLERSDFLYFDTRIWRIAEVFLHCENVYRLLGVDENDVVVMSVRHAGLRNRKLAASDPLRDFKLFERKMCHEDVSLWEQKSSLKELREKRLEFVVSVARDLFVLFDGWQPEQGIIEGIYEQFMKSKIS